MNCEPYGEVARDARWEDAAPFLVAESLHLSREHGISWAHRPGTIAVVRRVCEQDDARYMEAVRR